MWTPTGTASCEQLTAVIDSTSQPVAMRMKLKKEKKIDAWGWQFHACADTPPLNQLTSILACGVGSQHNQLCQFFENWSRGLRAGIPRKMAFPIESVHRCQHYRAALWWYWNRNYISLVQICHVVYLLQKVAKRMYCINYLVWAGILVCDVVCVYCAIIRSVLEYARLVWYPGLTKRVFEVGQFNYVSQIFIDRPLVAMITKIWNF